MPGKRQRYLIGWNTGTIICHFDQALTRTFDGDLDRGCPGINCIFDEFLDNRSRSFDHLPGSYL